MQAPASGERVADGVMRLRWGHAGQCAARVPMSNWTGRRRRAGLRWRLAPQETPYRVPETVFGEGSSPCQAHVDPGIGIGLGSPRVGLASCKEPPNKPPLRRSGRHLLIRWVVNAAARQTPIPVRVTSYFGPRWLNPIDLDRGRRDDSLKVHVDSGRHRPDPPASRLVFLDRGPAASLRGRCRVSGPGPTSD